MTAYRIYLCPLDQAPEIPNPECSNSAQHTPCPPGYVEFFEWAASMSYRGSRQSRCSVCDLYVIWSVPARPAKAVTR